MGKPKLVRLSAKLLIRRLKKASAGGTICVEFVPRRLVGKVFPARMVSRGQDVLRFAANDDRGQALFLLRTAIYETYGLARNGVPPSHLFEVYEYLADLWGLVVLLLATKSNAPEIRLRKTAIMFVAEHTWPGILNSKDHKLFLACVAVCDDPRHEEDDLSEAIEVAQILFKAKALKDRKAVDRLWIRKKKTNEGKLEDEGIRRIFIRHWEQSRKWMLQWRTCNPWVKKSTWGLHLDAWDRFENIESEAYQYYRKWMDKLEPLGLEHNQSLSDYFNGKAGQFIYDLRRKACENSLKEVEGEKEIDIAEDEDTVRLDQITLATLAEPDDSWTRPAFDDLITQLRQIADNLRRRRQKALSLVEALNDDPNASRRELATRIKTTPDVVGKLLDHFRKELRRQGLFPAGTIPRPSYICRIKKRAVKRTVQFPEGVPSIEDRLAEWKPDPFEGRAVLRGKGVEKERTPSPDRRRGKLSSLLYESSLELASPPKPVILPPGFQVKKLQPGPERPELRYDYVPEERDRRDKNWEWIKNIPLSRLRGLPRNERYILLRTYWGRATHAEIAEELGVSKFSSRVLLSRAIASLRP
jgi:hypothetical protein